MEDAMKRTQNQENNLKYYSVVLQFLYRNIGTLEE